MRSVVTGIAIPLCSFAVACQPVENPALSETSVYLTSGDYGLDLILPIVDTPAQTVTRGYNLGNLPSCRDVAPGVPCSSHQHYAAGIWDDYYALDIAGLSDCSGYRTPVVAAARGVVTAFDDRPEVRASMARSYGPYHVVIDHGNSCFSHYAHLEANVVAVGQNVEQGQLIGYQGNEGSVTGRECKMLLNDPNNPNDDEDPTGSHLHFKVFCNGVGVKPEPLSGYTNIAVDARFHDKGYKHLPVGTLAQVAGQPELYMVTSADQLMHVPDWATFVARRFFNDATYPTEKVVTISKEARDCHKVIEGSALPAAQQAKLVACGSEIYVAFQDGAAKIKRRVPFTQADQRYAPLLRSWGFRTNEMSQTTSAPECAFPNGTALKMRPGTVVEEASDNDFWLVTSNTYRANDVADPPLAVRAQRMSRYDANGKAFMPELYTTYGVIVHIPDGTIGDYVNQVQSGESYDAVDAAVCPVPSGGVGGGSSGGTCNECAPGAGVCDNYSAGQTCAYSSADGCYHWQPLTCSGGLMCSSGQCVTPPTSQCARDAKRCHDGSTYDFCDYNPYSLKYEWKSYPCAQGWTCGGSGVCSPPSQTCSQGAVVCTGMSSIAICQSGGSWLLSNCASGMCFNQSNQSNWCTSSQGCPYGTATCLSDAVAASCQYNPLLDETYWFQQGCGQGYVCDPSYNACVPNPQSTPACYEGARTCTDTTHYDLCEKDAASGAMQWQASTCASGTECADPYGQCKAIPVDVGIYADSLASSWEDWSWTSTRTFGSSERVYLGTTAIKVVYTSAWGGLYLANPSPVTVGPATRLRFAINGGLTGAQRPVVQLYDTDGRLIGQDSLLKYVPGGSLVANTWHLADVPLASLGLTSASIGGFAVMSDVATTMYFDDIRLQNVVFPAPVYADSLASGWEDWSWGSTRTFNSAEKIYLGTSAIKIVYTSAWGGLYLANPSSITVGPATRLRFAVHGGSTGGQHPYVQLYDTSGGLIGQDNLLKYIPSGAIAANTWHLADIPLASLGLTGLMIGGFAIESDVATTMYFDEVRLQDVALPAPVYADALSSGWQDWSWGSTRTFNSTERVYLGTSAVKVAFTVPWGGLYLGNPSPVAVSSTAKLRFAINGGSIGGQHPYVQLYNTSGGLIGQDNLLKYVPGGSIAANTWYLVEVPLASLGLAGTTIGGFAVMSDIATTIYFDEIRIQ